MTMLSSLKSIVGNIKDALTGDVSVTVITPDPTKEVLEDIVKELTEKKKLKGQPSGAELHKAKAKGEAL